MLWESVAPFQRMNVTSGNPVHADFLPSLEALGSSDYAVFQAGADPAFRDGLRAMAARKQLHPTAPVRVFKGRVRQHLRRGLQHHHHHEEWFYAVFDERILCPLWRTSEGAAPHTAPAGSGAVPAEPGDSEAYPEVCLAPDASHPGAKILNVSGPESLQGVAQCKV